MKKFFKSAFSLSVALSLVCSAVPSLCFAEDMVTNYSEGSITGFELIESDEIFSEGSISLDAPKFYANYSENAVNYGNYLDENNVRVYLKFMELINPSTDAIKISLPEPVSFEASSPDSTKFSESDFENLKNAVYDSCWAGMICATFDMPELFWIDLVNTDIAYAYSTARNRTTGTYTCTINTITLTPSPYEAFTSMNNVLEYKDKLDEALENFEIKGDTRYEQLRSVHDAISTFTYYDMESPFSGSVLGSLVEPGAVCESYSKAFKLICDRLSIPCVCVFGNYNLENKSAHMWNYVLMDDNKWYAVDVTWDDRDGKNDVEYNYKYFLKGSDSFFSDHTPEEYYMTARFVYPEISADDYDPSSVSDISTETPVETTTTTTTVTTTSTITTTTSATASTVTSTITTQTTAEETTVTETTTRKTPSRTTATTAETTSTATETTAETTTEKADIPVYGDLNHDGICNVADLVYCSNAVLGKTVPEYSCDVNGDGFENVFDVIIMREVAVEDIYILH